MEKTVKPEIRTGSIAIPASKSDGQRAYLAAALAKGRSVISGSGKSDDEQAMLRAIQTLGAVVAYEDGNLLIDGIAHFPETAEIAAGESGLGVRLLGMICAAHNGRFTITGEGSLISRPMQFFEEVLPQFGGSCSTNEGKLPLQIHQPMKGGEANVDGSLSSQFISGLLMALPLVENDSVLLVDDLKSSPYVQMTLQTLKAFGIEITHEQLKRFEIRGNQQFQPSNYHVDADWSSASCWLVASALGHDLTITGLRFSSLQADKQLLSFLLAANCKVMRSEDGIMINGSAKTAFTVDATDCPDLFPALVTLAAFCEGKSVIMGASRLVHKESHRGLALQSEFEKLGVRIDLEEDRLIVHGTGRVTGGIVQSHHDHRIAMCLAIAGFSAASELTIEHAEAVSKSYPEFWAELEAIDRRSAAAEPSTKRPSTPD